MIPKHLSMPGVMETVLQVIIVGVVCLVNWGRGGGVCL